MHLIDLGRGPVKLSFQSGPVRVDQILIFPNLKVIIEIFYFFLFDFGFIRPIWLEYTLQ